MDARRTGEFIKKERKKLNLSQSKLAEMLFVEPQTISKWERGLGMPDYDNIDRLREIFGCSLTDILEPKVLDETCATVIETSTEESGQLLVLEQESNEKKEEYNKFKFSDFLNTRRMKEAIGRLFGVEYVETYNEKFLTKNILKKRTKEDLEMTITQGMFKDKMGHQVLGVQAPWLYMRVFFFMLLCTIITLGCAAVGLLPPFVLCAALLSTLPLLLFLFESNFSRNMSIIDVLKIFMLGGVWSLLITIVMDLVFLGGGEVVQTVVVAPIIEEICKAIMVVYFVKKIKPDNILTGLLIGFSIGAGFAFFENLCYAINVGADSDKIIPESIVTICVRSLGDFFGGHHYYTGIFSAIYVFLKGKNYSQKQDIVWRSTLALLLSIALHSLWNGGAVLGSLFLLGIDRILCVTLLITLINVGIAQVKVSSIAQDYFSDKAVA